MPTKKPSYLAGVDLGGTKIMTGIFDENLDLVGIERISTKPQRGPDVVMERIERCIAEAVDECDLQMSDLKAVGIGAPGSVEPETGKVIFAPNLEWRNIPLKSELEAMLKHPVFVENDCTICTLGVHEKELGGEPRHMTGIFIGTGIGGGLILDGELYSGFNRTAGELGHMVIDANGPECGCGNRGCFEALASRTALTKKILAAVEAGQETLLTDILGGDLSKLRSGPLRKAIRKGDKFILGLVQEAAHYTGIAVGNIINILNPEVVVLGGGIMEALEAEMMPIIEKTAKAHALAGTSKGVKIIASALADNAGIFGGAVLARRGLNRPRSGELQR